jgi:hypothetical protein
MEVFIPCNGPDGLEKQPLGCHITINAITLKLIKSCARVAAGLLAGTRYNKRFVAHEIMMEEPCETEYVVAPAFKRYDHYCRDIYIIGEDDQSEDLSVETEGHRLCVLDKDKVFWSAEDSWDGHIVVTPVVFISALEYTLEQHMT